MVVQYSPIVAGHVLHIDRIFYARLSPPPTAASRGHNILPFRMHRDELVKAYCACLRLDIDVDRVFLVPETCGVMQAGEDIEYIFWR